MCLAIPGRIVSIDGTTARIDYNGVTGEASSQAAVSVPSQ